MQKTILLARTLQHRLTDKWRGLKPITRVVTEVRLSNLMNDRKSWKHQRKSRHCLVAYLSI
jgi:hypothetical protein